MKETWPDHPSTDQRQTLPSRLGLAIVVTVPASLTGPLELHLAMELNGSVREGIYPFPLT